ncbi:MAG: hypothetical protein QXI16_00575 [Sulfolobaceae archaeon]
MEKNELLTEEEKEFLSQFKFLKLIISNNIYMYSTGNYLLNNINLNNIYLKFDRLIENTLYYREELGL